MPLATVLAVLLIYGVTIATSFAGDDTETTLSIYPEIIVDDERQNLAGLKISEAGLTRYSPEFRAFGRALDVQPLLALRLRYLQAKAEHSMAQARFDQSQQDLDRTRHLVGDGIAAKRRLQEQRSQWQADKSHLDAASYTIAAVTDEARLNWGQELAGHILAADSDYLDSLVSGRTVLLQITLPADRPLPDADVPIFVDPFGDRNSAQTAVLIASAPKIDNMLQGRNYFFQASYAAIKAGMNVSAWVRDTANDKQGILIPKSAVLWSMGEAYVYLKTGTTSFARRMIDTGNPSGNGYFIEKDIKPGELVVTTGSHVLWSEENRKQNPSDED